MEPRFLLTMASLLVVVLSGCTTHTTISDAMEGREFQAVELDKARIFGSVNDHGDTWGFRIYDKTGGAERGELIVVIVSKENAYPNPESGDWISVKGELREMDGGEVFIAASRIKEAAAGW